MSGLPRYPVLDKVVLITGPARGIGAELARQLARRGAKLALVGLEPDRLEALAGELGPETAAWWEADVRDWDALRAATEGAVERFGGIDVVVPNAGIAPWGTVETIDPDAFEATIEVNLLGVWRTIRTALPHVIERRGYIAPVASLAAAVHAPLLGHYAAAKAGVEAMANSLRVELSGSGVDVGVVYFAFLDTDMVRAVEADPEASELLEVVGPVAPVDKAVERIVAGIERRSRRVWYPPYILPALLAPAPVQRIAELGMRRRDFAETVRRVNEKAKARLRT